MLSWLISLRQPDCYWWCYLGCSASFWQSPTHPLARLWDIGDCHKSYVFTALGGLLIIRTDSKCPSPHLGLCPLFLLCCHQGVREWVTASPGLWSRYGSRRRTLKLPSAFWLCCCRAGHLFSIPGWTNGACPQVPRGNLHPCFSLDCAAAFEAKLSATTLALTSQSGPGWLLDEAEAEHTRMTYSKCRQAFCS